MGSVLNMEPLTIALVGCGKSKLDHAAPARQLYTGSLFVAASRWAAECDGWFILSAKFGLLDPETVVEPYEVRLGPEQDQLVRDVTGEEEQRARVRLRAPLGLADRERGLVGRGGGERVTL